MNQAVGYKVREGIALISVDNPPVNALSQAVRGGLLTALEAAIANPDVGAIVIQAEGRTFPAGADLRDLRARIEPPRLGDVCDAIENSPKPVLAAIHGTALGGGLELALACHYRLAHVDAQLGLPDVALGVVPAAGASQRLPRIVGAKTALDMMISARPISAEGAARIGLIDKVIQKNLDRAAFGSARNIAGTKTGPRPTRARGEGLANPRGYLEAVEEKRALMAKDAREAVHRAIDLVEAALLLPFKAGLELERVAFEDLVESDQARGLRHAFLAERRTVRGADLAPAHARAVDRIGIDGAGRRAQELAGAALAAKRRVVLHDEDPLALDAARARIEAVLAQAVEEGELGAAKRDAQLAWLTVAPDPEALAVCDILIEAFERDGAALKDRLARLGAVAAPEAVLACTSAVEGAALDTCAEATGRPADVIGLRLCEAAHENRLVEVVRRDGRAPGVGATGVALARALGKVAVLPARPGYSLVGPLFDAVWRAACWLVEEGASPGAVDAALVDWGFAEGPFVMTDRIGLDRLTTATPLIVALRARGLTRVHDGDRPETLSPGAEAVIAEQRETLAVAPRSISDHEIADRVLAALVRAGADLVAQGIAARPSDIDAAMVLGLGFPRWRGGPMEAADLAGLLKMRGQLRAFGDGRDGDIWTPGTLLDDLIKNGLGFDSLNR